MGQNGDGHTSVIGNQTLSSRTLQPRAWWTVSTLDSLIRVHSCLIAVRRCVRGGPGRSGFYNLGTGARSGKSRWVCWSARDLGRGHHQARCGRQWVGRRARLSIFSSTENRGVLLLSTGPLFYINTGPFNVSYFEAVVYSRRLWLVDGAMSAVLRAIGARNPLEGGAATHFSVVAAGARNCRPLALLRILSIHGFHFGHR
jgi:hypothetical protein